MVGIRLARMGGVRSGENCVLMSRVRQIRFFLVLLPRTSEVCLVLLLYVAQVLLRLLLDFAWVLLLLFDFTCADKQLAFGRARSNSYWHIHSIINIYSLYNAPIAASIAWCVLEFSERGNKRI